MTAGRQTATPDAARGTGATETGASARARFAAEALAATLPPLQVAAERVAATVAHGLHGRRRAGQGETFWQFRRYQPFDPARMIDWRRSAKSGRVFVREMEWEAAQSVWIWRDASPSMDYRSARSLPTKRARADLLALALAVLLSRGGETVALLGAGLPARGGRAGLRRFTALLMAAPAGLGTGAGLPPADPLPRHAGLVLIGDFMDPFDRLEPVLAHHAANGSAGHLLRIADPAEESFPFRGRARFEGMEAEAPHLLNRADAVRAEYARKLAEHRAALQDWARAAGWTLHHHATDRPPEGALMALYMAMAGPMPGAVARRPV